MLIQGNLNDKDVKSFVTNKTLTKLAADAVSRKAAAAAAEAAHNRKPSRVNLNEQRELYRQHRQRLAQVKGKVNTYLPRPRVKVASVPGDKDLSYMEIMAALYSKNGSSPQRTFTKSPERLAAGRWRNASVARQKEREQAELSKHLIKGGDWIYKASEAANNPKRRRQDMHKDQNCFSYEIPLHILHRYETLMPACDIGMLCKLLRPQVYLDVALRGMHAATKERIVIQLFTEACPQIVLEFMRICTLREYRRIVFTRIFSPLWLEGKLALALDAKRSICMDSIEHDFETLNHGVDAGILSFPSRYVRGSKLALLTFTISFRPLAILNGKRIAFGKIRKGLSFLEHIQRISTTKSSGKPKYPIIITDCGVL